MLRLRGAEHATLRVVGYHLWGPVQRDACRRSANTRAQPGIRPSGCYTRTASLRASSRMQTSRPHPVLMSRKTASVPCSAIIRMGRPASIPTARPEERDEGLTADVGEEGRQASAHARRALLGARAERRPQVCAVQVHRAIGCVCVGARASRRRSAACCCLASCPRR
jgi:hypothetical protein